MKNMVVFNMSKGSTRPTRFNGVKAQHTHQIHKPIKKGLIYQAYNTETPNPNKENKDR